MTCLGCFVRDFTGYWQLKMAITTIRISPKLKNGGFNRDHFLPLHNHALTTLYATPSGKLAVYFLDVR